jgi:hypothetical protein
VLHHVEADAATRYVGDSSGGGKTGTKDQTQRVLIADSCARFEQALCDGDARHALLINAAPIVRHTHAHAAAFRRNFHTHTPARRLPRRASLRRRFDAVINRVAQQVQERLADLFRERTIDTHVAARNFQLDLFPRRPRGDARRTRRAFEHGHQRLHAQTHHALFQRAEIFA